MSGGHIPEDETMIQLMRFCIMHDPFFNSYTPRLKGQRICDAILLPTGFTFARRGCRLVPGTAEDDADNPDFPSLPTLRLTSNMFTPKDCTPPTPSVRQQSGRPNLQHIVGVGGQLQMEV